MKKLTKALSILLAVALVCTGLVLAVGASEAQNDTASYRAGGETLTGTLVEALAAADGNSTVTLLGDCTLEETFTVTKGVTVDLNGYTLTSKKDAFAIGANNVTFAIEGTGTMNLAGKLAYAPENYSGFSVSVVGKEATEGIKINHTASNIASTTHGEWTFTNLDIDTTSNLAKADVYFKVERNDEASANWYFNLVEFDSRKVAYKGSTGNFIVNISGYGCLSIDSSSFRTQNSAIAAYHNAPAEGEEASLLSGDIVINDSFISCLNTAPFSKNHRNYVLLGQNIDVDGNDSMRIGFNGTITLEGSKVECNSRVFCIGNADEATVEVNSSTVRLAGIMGQDDAHSLKRGNATTLTISGSSSFISVAKDVITDPPVGTRVNDTKIIKDLGADKKLVYDPIGNQEAPFLVAAADDNSAYPDFYKYFGFDNIHFGGTTQKDQDEYKYNKNIKDRDMYVDNKSTKDGDYSGDNQKLWGCLTGFKGTGGMQWDARYGTISHVQNESSSYIRYWIQEGAKGGVVQSNGRLKWTNVKDESGNTTVNYDTYLVMGLDPEGNYSTSGNVHESACSGDNRKAVSLVEFDFTSNSAKGYVEADITAQVRNNNGGGENGDRIFSLTSTGAITNLGFVEASGVAPVLKPAGEWNRISFVCYSDPSTSRYRVYTFLNGEYLGWSYLTDKSTAGSYVFFQGVRINMWKTQTIGAELLVDNVSFRSYTDYQFEGECDATYNTETSSYNNDGVYYPEKYIIAAPAQVALEPAVTVNGIPFSDVNEALEFAAENNTVVDINRDLTLTAAANGTVNTNGNNVVFTDASYGSVADGNLVTFDSTYYYDAYFFTGDASKLGENYVFDINDFEKVTVRVGDYLNKDLIYTAGAAKDFDKKAIGGAQNGWATVIGAEDSVLPKVVDLADLSRVDENNAVYYYPSYGLIPMNYYVIGADGKVYAGDITNEQALVDFQALKGGDTFVLEADINISKSGTIFANTTDNTQQVINIDLNGHTLSLSEKGTFITVGSYTTLNVYSSKAGGALNCVTYEGGAIAGNIAFCIDDPSVTSHTSPDLANNVKSAKINVGTIASVSGTDGANMKIYAEVAYRGRVGDDDCTIVSDGVDIYSPTNLHTGYSIVDLQLFNGDVYVKNSAVLAVLKNSLVNISSFYKSGNKSGTSGNTENEYDNRKTNFENTIMTGYVEFENCIFVNTFAEIGDGIEKTNTQNNIVSNNGDGGTTRKNVKFKNVVATGRLNPSNDSRNAIEGFVATENMDTGNGFVGDTKRDTNYRAPMTWDIIDLGVDVENGVHTFEFTYFDSESGRLEKITEYSIANYGTEISGANSYNLPILAKATDYESNWNTVNWMALNGTGVLATQNYIKGDTYRPRDINVTEYTQGVVTLKFNGTWQNIPAYITEDVNIIPGYTAEYNLSGIKANLSLYSDFDINLYIPAAIASSITVDGYTLTDATLNGAAYKKLTVTQACDKTTDVVTFTLNVSETVNGVEYATTKVINYSVAKYAKTVLDSASLTNADKILVYYMLNYANAATAYVSEAANEELGAMLTQYSSYGDMYTAQDATANAVEDTKLAAVFAGATVTLDPKPAFVLTTKAGFVGTVTVKYEGSELTRVYTIGENTKRDIVIEEMQVYNFAENLVITAEGTLNGEAVSVTEGSYNLATFAKYHSDNAENAASAACLPLVKALSAYAAVAKLYVAGTLA